MAEKQTATLEDSGELITGRDQPIEPGHTGLGGRMTMNKDYVIPDDISETERLEDGERANRIGCQIENPVRFKVFRVNNNSRLIVLSVLLAVLVLALIYQSYRYEMMYQAVDTLCLKTEVYDACMRMLT